MIECWHIDFSYDSKTILQGIDLNIENGEFLCILGQSGCGKSTLLRLLAGLERPSAGEIRIDGEPVDGPDRHCSVVFQDYSLFPWMTTGANLTLALHAAYPDKNRKAVLSASIRRRCPAECASGRQSRGRWRPPPGFC